MTHLVLFPQLRWYSELMNTATRQKPQLRISHKYWTLSCVLNISGWKESCWREMHCAMTPGLLPYAQQKGEASLSSKDR